MLYPEMPKSKKKATYIVGGIFALLVGLVIFLLFLPSFLDKNFGFKPWDWTTIIPNLNSDFFGAVGFYMKLALPIILFLCAASSLFMGLSKSGGLFKGSIMASTLALVLKHSLEPANLKSNITGMLEYVSFGLIGVSLVLAILGSIFRFMGEEPYAPFRANSFHFYASYALILIAAFDVFASVLGMNAIVSNVNYYLGTVLGLFLIVAAIWMFCTSSRDSSEFGLGYEREARIKADTKAKAQQTANPAQQGAVPVPPILGPDGKPIQPQPAMPQNGMQPGVPPVNPNMQQAPQGVQTAAPQTQNPQVQPQVQPQAFAPGAAPAQAANNAAQPRVMPNGQQVPPTVPRIGPDGKPLPPMPPRPAMPPRIGPDGRPLPPMPPRPAMPPRVGPDGKPLPPMPPRPAAPASPAQQAPQAPQTTNNKTTDEGK